MAVLIVKHTDERGSCEEEEEEEEEEVLTCLQLFPLSRNKPLATQD